jgi:hypothetical protein
MWRKINVEGFVERNRSLLQEFMGQLSDEWYSLCMSAERAFSRDGYARAEELWMEALPLAEQFGETDERYTKTILGVTRSILMQKRDWDAIPWLTFTIDLFKRNYGIYNETIARITHKLANIYRVHKMPIESEEMFKMALDVNTKTYGPTDEFTIEVLGDYAELLTELHREDEAQHMLYCATASLGGSWNPKLRKPTAEYDLQQQEEQP